MSSPRATTSAALIPPRRRMQLGLHILRYGPSWLAGIVGVVLLVGLAFDQGGYFSPSYLGAGAIAYAVLGGLLLLRAPRFAISSRGLLGLAALAGLAAWTALSSNWSLTPDTALEYAQRDLVYVGLFALALVAAGSGRHTRRLVWGALIGITVIVVAGLLSRVAPDLVSAPQPPSGRLEYPIGYWNGYGCLGAMGTILALGLAADIRSGVTLRVLSAGAAVLMATATYMSLSRGSDLALIFGLLVLTVLTVRAGTLLLTFAAVGGGVAAAILRLQAYRVLLDRPARKAVEQAAGHAFARELALIVAVVMGVTALIALGRMTPVLQRLGRRSVPTLKRAALGIAVCVIALGVIRAHDVSRAVDSGTSFISRQANDFWHPSSGQPSSGQARLTSLQTTRSDLYRIVFAGFTADPLRGDGGGGSFVRYIRMRKYLEVVHNAHSLELETLGELGIVGLALLIGFIATVIVGAIRTRFHPAGGLSRSQSAAVSAACAVWLIHSGFDWDWQLTAVTGFALVLASTLYPTGSRRRRRRRRTSTVSTPSESVSP